MAQPPLSQQIRQLEAELGVTLLRRTTRRVDLTDAGAAYLDRARAILAAVDEAGAEAQRVDQGLVGRLADRLRRVGDVQPVAGPGARLCARSCRASTSRSAARCSCRTRSTALLAGDHRPGPAAAAGRRARAGAAAAAEGPADRRPAGRPPAGRPAAGAGRGPARRGPGRPPLARPLGDARRWSRTCAAEAGFRPRIRHEVAETSTLVTFVAAGLGVAVVPEPVGTLGVPGVTYRPLSPAGAGVELATGSGRGS